MTREAADLDRIAMAVEARAEELLAEAALFLAATEDEEGREQT